ncbi:ABC transporter substrate-binding protein [Phytohabitans kaempferiae]|uniref:ABC transporter substrate-binding protein n=1 Tax=Phytohabitans kaempferiae TaxID=1620943 RepID=A0ABV6M5H7_9ACTN
MAVAFAAAAALLLNACGSGSTESGDGLPSKVTIGAGYDVTGAASAYGKANAEGAQIAIDLAVEDKMLGDSTPTLKLEDTGSEPNQVPEVFQKLARDKEVVAFAGGTQSSGVSLALPLTERFKLPFVVATAATPGLLADNEWAFRTTMSNAIIFGQSLDLAIERFKPQHVGVVFDQANPTLADTGKIAQKAFNEAGISDVRLEGFDGASTTDFAPFLTKVSRGDDLDLLVSLATGQAPAQITSQARKLGIDVPILAQQTIVSPDYLKGAGAAAANSFTVGTYRPELSDTELSKRFVAAYEAKYGKQPDQFAGDGFHATWFTLLAIKEADSTDREAVREAMATVTTWDGLPETITMKDRDAEWTGIPLEITTDGPKPWQ